MGNFLNKISRLLLLSAATLCLSGSLGVGAKAQNAVGTTPIILTGGVYYAELIDGKPQNLIPAGAGILVKACCRQKVGDKTNDDGEFSIKFNVTGTHYLIVADLHGYRQHETPSVWISNEKPQATVKRPQVYVVNSAQSLRRQVPQVILILYRDGGPASGPSRASPPSRPQQSEKGVSGRVLDRSGKPVGGATVLVLVTREDSEDYITLDEGQTNEEGYYQLKAKEIEGYDEYLLSITHQGFNRSLSMFKKGEVPPPTIKLDEVSYVDEPLLEQTEATRRHVFTPRVMEALPVAGLRNFDTFALLAPGVAPPPETPNARGPGVSPGLGTAGQFSVNGLRSRENNFTVDGSDNNDEDIGTRRQGFVALAPQSIESLNEFQIITALPDARFGRNIGGQVNALTKSGSPEFHGSLYGFVTDSRFNARNFFDQTTGSNPASFSLKRQSDGADVLLDGRPLVSPNPVEDENPLTRTQLGFAVGGPIKKVGGSFFVALERVKTRANRESHFIVPTVEQRGLFDAGATGLLLDRQADGPVLPVPLPLYAASVPGDAIFSLYPLPNNPLGPYGHNTYTAILPADAGGTRLSAKIDRQFGRYDANKSRSPWSFLKGGDIFTGRYNLSQEASTIPVTGEALFSLLRPRVRTQNMAFYLNRRLTSRISDVIRFSYGRTKLGFGEVRDPFLSPSSFFPDEPFLLNAPLLINVTVPRSNGTLTQPSFVSASSQPGTALLSSLGYAGVTHAEQIAGPLGQVNIPGFTPLGVDVYNLPQSRANNTIQVAETVTFVSSAKRIFTFGAEVRKMIINSTLDRNFRPLALFGGLRTSSAASEFLARLPGGSPLAPQVYGGTTLAALGVPTGLFQTLAATPNSTIGIRFTQASFFAQHNWRARDNLTFNLGVRFNYVTGLSTKGNVLEKAFNPVELHRQGQEAVEDCFTVTGNRPECARVADLIVSAFPADFKTLLEGEKRDLDVRTGLAWAVNDKTVVRVGFGTFSGEFPGVVLGQSRNAFPAFLPLNFADLPVRPRNELADRVFLFNPANPTLLQSEPTLGIAPGTLNTLLPNFNAISLLSTRLVGPLDRPFSRNVLGLNLVLPQGQLHNPYSLQYAVTLERQLRRRYAVSLAYVGTRGIKLLRISTPELGLNRSRLLEPTGLKVTTQGNSPFPFPGGVLLPPQEIVPGALLAISQTLFESSASSTYNSLQVELRKQYAQRFQFRTAFTYSHAIDDASDFFDTAGAFALPQDSIQRSERASSNFDVKLRSVTHFVRDFPKDLFFSGPTKFGGWQVAGIVTAQTGQPFTVNSAFDINRDGNLTDRLDRTAGLIQGGLAGDSSVQLSLAPGTNPLDLLADDGRDGAVGRNTFRAPSQFSFDLSITKFFNFNDRVRLNARTEIFNLFNRTNFGIPVRILESPAFGKSTYTTTPPRTIQLVVKLVF